MYSHEIEELLKLKQCLISIHDYCEIIKTSPQVDHIKFENEHFKMYTTDGYKFKFKIKEARSKS